MTVSTGKAATGVDTITLHSAFHLPAKLGLKSYGCKKPSDKTLHMLSKKYQYLKVLIMIQILMIRRQAFDDLAKSSLHLTRSNFKSYNSFTTFTL